MKSGTVVITGKPNVGKSTLINTLAKKEVAITSSKPQTTRNQINYVYSDNKYNIAFLDTPGFHFANNKLDEFLNRQIKSAYKYADVAYLMIDPTREINDEDYQVIKLIKLFNIPYVILIINKIDLVNELEINNFINKVKNLIKLDEIIQISALKKININELLDKTGKYLSNEPIDIANTDGDNFIISEIIREQIIKLYHQEIPYSSNVVIPDKKYDPTKNLFIINATINVEKESQKPIIIGAKGSKIKILRIQSLKKLHKIYDCKIELHLFVAVKPNWRNKDNYLKDSGYF